MMKKARYYGIPCYYNPETNELNGRNKFYDAIVFFILILDANFGSGDFKILIEEEL